MNQTQQWMSCFFLPLFLPSTQGFHIPGFDKWKSSYLLGVFPCKIWYFIILFLHYHCNKDSVGIDRLKHIYTDLMDSPSLANPNCSPTQHSHTASGSTPLNNPDTQSTTPSPVPSVSLSSNTTSSQQRCYPNIRPTTTYTGSRSKTPIPIAQVHHPILGIDFLQHFDMSMYVPANSSRERLP